MFRVKICGITSVEDALLAAEAGADAIGLNFYEKGPRYVAPQRAADISAACAAEVCTVGVFVNSAVDRIVATQQAVGLLAIQLHGDEPPATIFELRAAPLYKMNHPTNDGFACDDVQIIRALRCRSGDLGEVRQFLDRYEQNNPQPKDERGPDALLLDAYDPAAFGGTGRRLNWQLVRQYRHPSWPSLILAGGLTPENVAEAIATARPDAVDVASGVESVPGKKDPAKVRAFVAAAKKAFAALDT